MLSIRHPHPAAAPSRLRCVWPGTGRQRGLWENQSVFQLLSSRHPRNRHGGVGVSLLLSPRAVPSEWQRGGSVPPVSPLTCAVQLVKLVISVRRIVQVVINETLGPSLPFVDPSLCTANAIEICGDGIWRGGHCSDQRVRTTRASPNHSIPMHSRRDARDLRSGQEPDSSEGRGRK